MGLVRPAVGLPCSVVERPCSAVDRPCAAVDRPRKRTKPEHRSRRDRCIGRRPSYRLQNQCSQHQSRRDTSPSATRYVFAQGKTWVYIHDTSSSLFERVRIVGSTVQSVGTPCAFRKALISLCGFHVRRTVIKYMHNRGNHRSA